MNNFARSTPMNTRICIASSSPINPEPNLIAYRSLTRLGRVADIWGVECSCRIEPIVLFPSFEILVGFENFIGSGVGEIQRYAGVDLNHFVGGIVHEQNLDAEANAP